MSKKVGELFVELAVDAASGNLSVRELVAALGDLDVASAGSVAIMGKVAERIWAVASAAREAAVQLEEIHATTGAEPKMVQQWEAAALKILHHSGTIVDAVKKVHAIGLEARETGNFPVELASYLGTTPLKAGGKPKQLEDLFAEWTKRNSWGHDQQFGLGKVFGEKLGNDLYLLMEAQRAGNFHPERELFMGGKQVADLNKVDAEWLQLQTDVTGVMRELMTSGGLVAGVLRDLDKDLRGFDEWMKQHSGTQQDYDSVFKYLDDMVSDSSDGDAWHEYVSTGAYKDMIAQMNRDLENKRPVQMKNWKGDLTIRTKDAHGAERVKTFPLDGDFSKLAWDWTDQAPAPLPASKVGP